MDRSVLTPLPHPPKPLPLVPGPKLPPFTRTAHATIDFIQELGDPGQDVDGLVWKVKIGGKGPYALKMFLFNSTDYLAKESAVGLRRRLASARLYSDYFDPFSCECRVYGRLKQEGREDLAARAHGYLLLTPRQAAEVEKRSARPKYSQEEYGKDGIDFWDRGIEHLHSSIRAIVKELVSPQDPFTPEKVPQIWDDLEDLHKLGIVVRDINTFNYMGGKIIDFSRAWTMPHPFPAAMSRYTVERTLSSEPLDLQNAFIEWGTPRDWDWDAIPEEMMRCTRGEGRDGPYGTDPSLYDWLKWEKDPATADAFMDQIFEKRG